MKYYPIGIIILSLSLFSCNDGSQYYSPFEVGTGGQRGPSQRNADVMDSTIAGIQTVVGSEWIYKQSRTFYPPGIARLDTSRIKIVSVHQDSLIGVRYTCAQIFAHDVSVWYIRIKGDTLFGGGIWGGSIIYPFPLSVGNRWRNPVGSDAFDSSIVLRKDTTTVKAGTFICYVIRDNFRSASTETTYRWYAPGVGIVKITGSGGSYESSDVSTVELLSFHIGARRR